MKCYISIVQQDQDSAYGVHFPDAARCFSGADDLAAAARHETGLVTS